MLRQNSTNALEGRTHVELTKDREGAPMRNLRDIAVLIPRQSGDTLAVSMAGQLARRAGAQLHLLQMLSMPVMAADAWALIPDPSLTERYAELRADAAQRARDWEHRLTGMHVAGEVRTLEVLYVAPSALAAAAARQTDLIIMARSSGSPGDVSIAHTYFAGLLLESGRPVIVVPEGTKAHLPPKHVLVAWADTAEAARAVHDALPLLEAAETVDVVIVDADKSDTEATTRSVETLMAHLRAHDVPTNLINCSSRSSSVGHALLDQASRRRAQLIVAGGYGHGRLREWALGGTTRELFMDSPIPVLFSH